MIKKLLTGKNVVSLISFVLGAGIDALCMFLLARTYAKEIFGDWVLYLSGAIFLDMVRSGLIYASLIKHISGITKSEKKEYVGSAYILSVILVFLVFTIFYAIYFTGMEKLNISGFELMFKWAPIYCLTTLIPTLSISMAQAEQNFGRVVLIRLFNPILLFVFLIINYFHTFSMNNVVLIQNISFSISSLICILSGWAEIKNILSFSLKKIVKLFHFGKYSLGTAIGSNLLKSVDVFLIGIFLGRAEVALYSIPLKLIEMINIPLNSFSAVLYPKMSEAQHKNQTKIVQRLFYSYTGLITILFIPFIVIMFIFARQFIFLLGGAEYVQSPIPVYVLRIFLIYSLFLPFDRFSGTSLDCINKPNFTFYKVLVMAIVNTLGDIAVLWLWKSLPAVSLITIVNVVIGTLLGLFFLKKQLKLQFCSFFSVCRHQIKTKQFLDCST